MGKKIVRRQYGGEFKQRAVEDLRNNRLSQYEVAAQYGISRSMIQRWERIYLEEGVAGLYIERRGRASAASGVQKGRRPKLDKQVEEDLVAENQRLRAEVAYLKNLQALVLEDERRQHKKRW